MDCIVVEGKKSLAGFRVFGHISHRAESSYYRKLFKSPSSEKLVSMHTSQRSLLASKTCTNSGHTVLQVVELGLLQSWLEILPKGRSAKFLMFCLLCSAALRCVCSTRDFDGSTVERKHFHRSGQLLVLLLHVPTHILHLIRLQLLLCPFHKNEKENSERRRRQMHLCSCSIACVCASLIWCYFYSYFSFNLS